MPPAHAVRDSPALPRHDNVPDLSAVPTAVIVEEIKPQVYPYPLHMSDEVPLTLAD